ncbi:MAG: DNA helicase RecQ [Bacteroidetes bacterium MED-G17]|nr:MAG: DNA helicase RecQ [Bacteroidetes bacterium MED-G17]
MQESIDLKVALKEFFGFDKFKGNQEVGIETILSGNDCFIIKPTGGGKSLCYQLPALISEGCAIIISPLIALMKNQVDAIRGFGESDAVAHFLNSTLTKNQSQKVKNDVSLGKTKLLYIAPETLKKEETIAFLKSVNISFVAVDEAHCISEWGHDFRPEYRQIKQMVKQIDNVPIMALTATATPKVQQDIQKNLDMSDAKVFKSSFNRDNLYYEIRPKGAKETTLKGILGIINRFRGKSGIIYCLSRKKVEQVAEILQANNIKALPYHAGMDTKTRSKHQDQFLMEEVDVIVATIAFGMGIDKPDVRFIIHYDVPKSIEGYYQETGRAGRDGIESTCVLFYNPNDIEKLEKFLRDKPVSEREIGEQLIAEMASYAESSQCRRELLLHYFGESYNKDQCLDLCDNCRHPKEKEDVTHELTQLLTVVGQTGGMVRTRHIVNILVGKAIPEVKAYKHHELPFFGLGKKRQDIFWKSLLRYAVLHGWALKNIEKYGLISITEEGKKFLKQPIDSQLAIDTEFEKVSEEDFENSKIESIHDENLFEILKEVQREVARSKGLPPYVIFQESALEDMATKYPINLSEMENINGVGKNKAKKFGGQFIEVIAKYVKENDIERPEDILLKSVVNKSIKKIHIIQNIDKKLPVEDIAKSVNLTMNELLNEMENIVYSGTKLDLYYYIDELMDEEVCDEIFDYFKESEDNSLDLAYEEFDEEFSHDELHIMRIQFISDVAN